MPHEQESTITHINVPFNSALIRRTRERSLGTFKQNGVLSEISRHQTGKYVQ
jgi:hypothetical protein